MRKPEMTPAPRMAALSVLPVFFKLEGKTALVAGTGEAVAWKAELLAASGAIVRVVAAEVCDAFARVLEQYPEQITICPRLWTESDFDGIALAIGGFDNASDAEAFAAVARAAGAPVNIIDKPDLCDFQFGSIVNRSPVVVGVSTDGAAPALGQAVRRRIETLLPPAIADWGRAARHLRRTLKKRLPDARARIDFWRRFAEAAFVTPVAEAEAAIERLLARKAVTQGKVSLVGAGPGDAGLLTLNAVRALQSADIILFDDLVSNEVLDLARREAKRMMVGKRGQRASCRQDDINETMLRLARQGKNIVRLKSGDPMIFGRAGEEIAMLEKAGVVVDVIPGVTAAIAAAARLKVSLTHRDCAQGVKFVTGHSRQGALPDLDWRACASGDTTLMVYMGARTAPRLAERLMEAGAGPQTPVIIAAAVSRPGEHVTATTLSQLQHKTVETDAPVLLGVGAVFAGISKNYKLLQQDNFNPGASNAVRQPETLDVAMQQ